MDNSTSSSTGSVEGINTNVNQGNQNGNQGNQGQTNPGVNSSNQGNQTGNNGNQGQGNQGNHGGSSILGVETSDNGSNAGGLLGGVSILGVLACIITLLVVLGIIFFVTRRRKDTNK